MIKLARCQNLIKVPLANTLGVGEYARKSYVGNEHQERSTAASNLGHDFLHFSPSKLLCAARLVAVCCSSH